MLNLEFRPILAYCRILEDKPIIILARDQIIFEKQVLPTSLDTVPCCLKTFSFFSFFMTKPDINLFIVLISVIHIFPIFMGNQKVIASMSR